MASLIDFTGQEKKWSLRTRQKPRIVSIIRKIFENKEENKNKKIVYSEKNSEKGEITYVNKFIHNKASLNFFFQITMNSENNFLRIQCTCMKNQNYICAKTKQIKNLVIYNLCKINQYHGSDYCSMLLDDSTGFFKGKCELYISYEQFSYKKDELIEKIATIQYDLRRLYFIFLKLANQLPENIPFKFKYDFDKKQREISNRTFNYLHTSIIQLAKSFSSASINTDEQVFQENIISKMVKESFPQFQFQSSKVFNLNIRDENVPEVSFQENQSEKKRKQAYLVLPITKNMIERQFVFSQIVILKPQKLQTRQSNFKGGTSKILISKMNFVYQFQVNSDSVNNKLDNVGQIRKVTTKFLAIKTPKQNLPIYKQKIEHQINILRLLSSITSQYFLRYYSANHQKFKYKDSLLMDLTINFESLDIFLKKKNLSFPLKLLILVNILQALRILKPQGIVHMDLSLSNILINDSFSIKLIDFGQSYSKRIVKKQKQKSYNPGFTLPFTFPERFTNTKNFNSKSDIFSFCVIMYFVFFKSSPFTRSHSQIQSLKNGTYFKKFFFAPQVCNYVGYEKIIYQIFAFIMKGLSLQQHKRPHPSKSIIFLKDMFYWVQDWLYLFHGTE